MNEHVTLLRRRFTRKGIAGALLCLLALSAGASLVDAASPPPWAVVAGAVLLLVLLRAIFLAFSKPAPARADGHPAPPHDEDHDDPRAPLARAREEADRQHPGRSTR